MDYIITKQTPRNEWRIYIDSDIKDEFVVYKGHKLGVETNILMEFLEYRRERTTNRIYFLNYQKIEKISDSKDMTKWIQGTVDNPERALVESWNSLQSKLKEKKPDFRKILITRVNI